MTINNHKILKEIQFVSTTNTKKHSWRISLLRNGIVGYS